MKPSESRSFLSLDFCHLWYVYTFLTAALACNTTNGHKPTAVAALKLVITKHMQNEKPDIPNAGTP